MKSLLKQIKLLANQWEGQDPEARARTEGEIKSLQTEMIQHCGGHIPTALYNIAAFSPPQPQQR